MDRNISLKPFLKQVQQLCASLDREELVSLIIAMARDAEPAERAGFYDYLRHCLAGESTESPADTSEEEIVDYLASVELLRGEIMERVRAIENGSFWSEQESFEEGWSAYDDDFPDTLSEEHELELATLFQQADACFLRDDYEAAARMYEALFDLLNSLEDRSVIQGLPVDPREEHARYCRALYEVTVPDNRAGVLLAVMCMPLCGEDDPHDEAGRWATIADIINANPAEMEGLDRFLPRWRELLDREDRGLSRVAELRLEVEQMLDGVAGVGKLARSWGSSQPMGYTRWLDGLAGEGQWSELARAALEGLDMVGRGSARAWIARGLVRAGRELGDRDMLLEGFFQVFASRHTGDSLLNLVAEAEIQGRRTEILDRAVTVVRAMGKGVHGRTDLLAKLHLMRGDLGSLAAMVQGKNSEVGWSGSSPGALLFCSVLSLTTGGRGVIVPAMLRRYADDMVFFSRFDHDGEDEKPVTTFREQINQGLAGVSRSEGEQYLDLVFRLGRARVDHIVSRKHRKAYGRAARTLCAMLEHLVVTADPEAARTLLAEYYFLKYNRYPAFRREVREALAESPLLESCGIGRP